MNENTVKPALTRRKREKRLVENDQFAAFTRRILRAYSRRIADGDVEALRSLINLASDVDTLTRDAVRGLRAFGYSWAEISSRLGVTRQAAQQRWGDPADRGALDRRLLDAGIQITVTQLVTLFADHHPGVPASAKCPGCEHTYVEGQRDCPTNVVVRPLLLRRRKENSSALSRLTSVQLEDLMTPATSCVPRSPWPGRTRSPGLFD